MLIERIFSQGLDVIGFSLAGIDEKNDRIREGTRINKILECMEEIRKVKNKYGSGKPKIHIAYMLLRSGLADLENLPEFLANNGADQTVVSSLSFVASPALAAESVLATKEKDYIELKHRFADVREYCAALGTEVHFHMVSPLKKEFYCSENVSRAVVVGSNGSLSPCVMKQMPVRGENYYYAGGRKHLQQNLTFGNILQESLNTIWYRKEYQHFIQQISNNDMPHECRNCLKAHIDNLV